MITQEQACIVLDFIAAVTTDWRAVKFHLEEFDWTSEEYVDGIAALAKLASRSPPIGINDF